MSRSSGEPADQALARGPTLSLESWCSKLRTSDSRNRRCPPGVRMLRIRPAAAQRVTVFGIDAEQCGHFARREQSLAWVHSLPLGLDSHAVQGQGSACADTQ